MLANVSCRLHPNQVIKGAPERDFPKNSCLTCALLSLLNNEYALDAALESIDIKPAVKKRGSAQIMCEKHPRYNAKRRSRVRCGTCDLIYVLRWQYTDEGERRLGSLNPFGYFMDGPTVETLGNLYLYLPKKR